MNTVRKNFLCIPLLLGFILGCHRGYIALWKDGCTDPVQVFPYRITTLPPADQEKLKDGIPVDRESDLTQLLEDYLS